MKLNRLYQKNRDMIQFAGMLACSFMFLGLMLVAMLTLCKNLS